MALEKCSVGGGVAGMGKARRDDEDHEERTLTRLARVREARACACNPAVRRYAAALREWYDDLPLARKREIGALETSAAVAARLAGADVPLRFRLLELPGLDDAARHRLLRKAEMLAELDEASGEAYKLGAYLQAVCDLPLGRLRAPALPAALADAPAFLEGVRARLDAAVFGMAPAKDAVMRLAARWAAAPATLGGTVLGLSGPPGVGKTSVAKAVADALGMAMAFVPLGGAQDGSFLEGHAITYEGSVPGRVADALTRARCMNPVLVFDEVDKLSGTARGREVEGILTHLVDPSQNAHFADKYFADLELDVSQAVFVFTMNDATQVSPVLRDRMALLHLGGYARADKAAIVRRHLLPELARAYALPAGLTISDDAMDKLLDRCPAPGVRDAKRALDAIVGGVNLRRLAEQAAPPAGIRRVDVTRFAPAPVAAWGEDGGPPPGMYT